jgi:hypothetical protein
MPISKQVNSRSLPAYMVAKRRGNRSGPVIGPLVFYTIGPITSSATIRANFNGLSGGVKGFHPIALTWGCTATTGVAVPMQFGTDTDALGGLTTMLNAAVDLAVVPTGTIYLDDTASTYYIVRSSTNDPEITANYVGIRLALSAASFDNLCVTLVGFMTKHVNLDKAND